MARGGFDTGDISEWDNYWAASPSRIVVGTAIDGVLPRQGSDFARFEVRGGDITWPGTNVTMVYRYDNVAGHYDTLGDDRYYAFSIYLPNSFPFVPHSVFNYFFELHGDNDGQAPVKIGLNSLVSRWNPSVGFVAELNSGRSPYSPTTKWWRLGGLTTGRWVDFVVHVRWASDPTGTLEVWRDGVRKISIRGVRTWYESGLDRVKPALGYYRSDYPQTAVLYLDAFKIGPSYVSVAP
jgi:hypothetical protein